MIELPKKLNFEPKQHLYSDDAGHNYISCSQLVHCFVNEFDPQGFITRACAKRNNMTVEQQKSLWKDINTAANIKGKAVHSELEDYINTGEIKDTPNKDIVEQFHELHGNSDLLSETQLYAMSSRIAGTLDVTEFLTANIGNILDFKTNKALHKKSKYRNKMLAPFSHLDDCNFNTYILQLGLYDYLWQENGVWIDKRILLYINPETRLIESHDIPYLEDEIKELVKRAPALARSGKFLEEKN